jgi:CRISPR-associated protein Cas5d
MEKQMRGKTHCLEVFGDFACFTRPEMKVERYSYPIITPSAARGIFDAIYWKTEVSPFSRCLNIRVH